MGLKRIPEIYKASISEFFNLKLMLKDLILSLYGFPFAIIYYQYKIRYVTDSFIRNFLYIMLGINKAILANIIRPIS